MGIAKDIIASNDDYQSVLTSHSTVFMLFVLPTCSPCVRAVELFTPIADSYDPLIKCLVLDTAITPRLSQVISTPTLVTHVAGKIAEVIRGFGPWETQEQTIREIFSRYARQQAPGEPALPAAPQPPRQ